MRHIITGGSGFTGKVLTRLLLDQGVEVIHFDLRPNPDPTTAHIVQQITGDIRNQNDLHRLELKQDDVGYHLAARQFADAVPRSGRDVWFEDVNVNGTSNIVQAMQISGTSKLIFFSTDMTYGRLDVCPIPPDYPQRPLGPYGRSKFKAEQVLINAEGISSTIFRPRLITGMGVWACSGNSSILSTVDGLCP